MKTRSIPVNVFREHAICDCGGELVSTGRAMTKIYTEYEHRCKKCGEFTFIEDDCYPRITYSSTMIGNE